MSGAGALALGTMLFGTRVDDGTAFAILDRFVERGGRWIDTADCYAFWLSDSGRGDDSERVIGDWLRARPGVRERIALSTKVGAEPTGDESWHGWPANREGLGREVVRRATRGSLARLGVEHVELLWLHQEDRRVPIEETVDAVGTLVAEGAVGRLGASNHPAWRVEAARRHASSSGGPLVEAVQLAMTYLRVRPGATPPGNDHPFGQASAEQLDQAADEGLDVWAYTPLLRGAYDRDDRPVADVYDHPGSTRRLARLREVADGLGRAPSQIVLAWLAGGAQPIVPIVGVSTVAQLDAACDALEEPLPADARAALDDVAP